MNRIEHADAYGLIADIRTELAKNANLLPATQEEAGREYRRARTMNLAPVSRIDGEWQGFRRRMMVAAREGVGANPNSERDQASRAHQLQIAREAVATFKAYGGLSAQGMGALWRQDREDVTRAISDRNIPSAAFAPAFDAALAVKQLAARGIVLSAGQGGVLSASPAGMLTEGECQVIQAHKAVLLALLTNVETVA